MKTSKQVDQRAAITASAKWSMAELLAWRAERLRVRKTSR
jgi:hypothetical protein